MDAAVRLEHSVLAVEEEHSVHCMLELAVPDAARARDPPAAAAGARRRPLRVDGGPEARRGERCARFLADRLRPTDRLALVAFDDDVQLIAPLRGRRSASRRGDRSIEPGGLHEPLGRLAEGHRGAASTPPRTGRGVLLLTDGLANAGITDPDHSPDRAPARSRAVTTTTIGFGEGFDEDLLRDDRRRHAQHLLRGDARGRAGHLRPRSSKGSRSWPPRT